VQQSFVVCGGGSFFKGWQIPHLPRLPCFLSLLSSKIILIMETINILLVVDCASILANETPGTASQPTPLDQCENDPNIWLMTAKSFCMNEQAKPELVPTSAPWQTVIWSGTCLANGTLYNVILQDIEPLQKGVVTPPVAVEIALAMYDAAPGEEAEEQSLQQYVFVSTVLNVKSGAIQYDICFSIVDTEGNTEGYYCWSPCIDLKRKYVGPINKEN
jgi:hypothetical protein